MDIKELRESLSVEDINFLLGEWGCCPLSKKGDNYTTETLCHNHAGEGSHKLYYYPNTCLWQCYTGCQSSFDIFELIVRHTEHIGNPLSLTQAISWVKNKMGIDGFDFEVQSKISDDWKIIGMYQKEEKNNEEPRKENKELLVSCLSNLSLCSVAEWVECGIGIHTHVKYGIRYYPTRNCIIIPHYNKNGGLVGIRQRTLEQEQIDMWGKYRPATIQGEMYNHHLGYELYGFNFNKESIKRVKKAIIFEGEKSVMIMDSLLGENGNVSVACCGSNISKSQIDLLLELEVNEIIIAFDKEFKEIGDAEFKRQVKVFESIHKKFSPYVKISFLFDKEGIMGYKSSPVDEGKDKFLHLYNNRITLEG